MSSQIKEMSHNVTLCHIMSHQNRPDYGWFEFWGSVDILLTTAM